MPVQQQRRGRPISHDSYFLQSFLVYFESIREGGALYNRPASF